jgi:hypothetical protein
LEYRLLFLGSWGRSGSAWAARSRITGAEAFDACACRSFILLCYPFYTPNFIHLGRKPEINKYPDLSLVCLFILFVFFSILFLSTSFLFSPEQLEGICAQYFLVNVLGGTSACCVSIGREGRRGGSREGGRASIAILWWRGDRVGG